MGVISSRIRRHRRTRLAAEMACTWTPRRMFPLGQEQGGVYYPDNPDALLRRRNWLTYSSQFDNAAWVRVRILSVTANADGVGDLVVPTTANSTHAIVQSPVVPGVPAAMTVRAKAGGYNWVAIQLGSTGAAYVNVSTGTAGSTTSGYSISTPVSAGSGYYDFTVSRTDPNVTSAYIFVANADGGASFTGDGTSGIYIARAHLDTYTTTPSAYQEVTDWTDDYMAAVGHLVTQYQDAAGTTPVTKVTDPVGLTLDRRFGGARGAELATNTTIAGLPAGGGTRSYSTGATVVSGRTYEIAATVTDYSGTSVVGFGTGASGTLGSIQSISANGTIRAIRQATANGLIELFTLTSNTCNFSNVSVRELPGNHRIQATSGSRKTLSARVNLLLATATMSTQNVTTVATSYKLSFTGTGTVTLSGTSTAGPLVGTGANDRVSLTFTPTAGTLTLTVSGSVTLADLRTADDAAKSIPAYQRVNTATDYDTDGFPHYWLYDGTDDSDATASTVDGSASDKVTVIAGVTKNSDAAGAVIAEHTASALANNGGFYVIGPAGTAQADYGVGSRGTSTAAASTSLIFASPNSSVVTMNGDIGADILTCRVNGTQRATSATDQGTGNYANATTYWGRRGGASAPFNGREYATILRFGPMSDSERNQAERWVAQRMGVTI